MSEDTRKPFTRSFPWDLQELLRAQVPLWDRLRRDIDAGEIFPAVRNREMHFYHKGGRLLAFDARGFRTHIKYVLTQPDGTALNDDLSESQLSSIVPIGSFSEGYGNMKGLCARYGEGEAVAVAAIWRLLPYTLCRLDRSAGLPPVVVLDLEASFGVEQEDDKKRKQDRIDLVLLNTGTKEILFAEAKLFSNGAIRSAAGNHPRIVEQIKRYRGQLAARRQQVLDAYGAYVDAVNSLLELAVPRPDKVIEEIPLLIVDFDSDQRDGRLAGNIGCLVNEHAICCLSLGTSGRATAGTLLEWFRQAKAFRRPMEKPNDGIPAICPFCCLPSGKAWMTNDHGIAYHDAFPISPGHMLVIPKRHVQSVFELGEIEQQALWSLVAEVRKKLAEEFEPDGFNIGVNDGRAAGQTVLHAHVHVIPRFKGDVADPRGGVRWIIPPKAKYWK